MGQGLSEKCIYPFSVVLFCCPDQFVSQRNLQNFNLFAPSTEVPPVPTIKFFRPQLVTVHKNSNRLGLRRSTGVEKLRRYFALGAAPHWPSLPIVESGGIRPVYRSRFSPRIIQSRYTTYKFSKFIDIFCPIRAGKANNFAMKER